MTEETLFEFETSGSRRDIAASIQALAGQLSGTGPVSLGDGDETVSVTPSEELGFEVDLERTLEDGEETFELEVEIEWRPTADAGTAAGDAEASSETVLSFDDIDIGAGAQTEEIRSLATFEVFEDRAEEWRWRLRHRNGNIIAASGEGYTSRQNAEKGLRSVVTNAPGADVVDG